MAVAETPAQVVGILAYAIRGELYQPVGVAASA